VTRARHARPWWRRRAALLAVALAALASVAVPAEPVAAMPAPAPPLPAPSSNGITLQSWSPVNPFQSASVPRLIDATMTTPAIFKAGTNPTIDPVTVTIKVRILVPAGYQTDPTTPYPVLYLLHGGGDDASAWADKGNVRNVVTASPFRGIVVMPDGGRAGWYSDWFGETDGRFSPQWETFHVNQLIPWIDANFNTLANRSGRAIAGLSMGGLGTLMYSARHTDLFSAVGSFSGGTDIEPAEAQAIVDRTMWVLGAATGSHGVLDGNYRVTGTVEERMTTVFGPSGGWDEKNPMQMAASYNAYDMNFGLYAGQSDDPDEGEHNIGVSNDDFHQALNENDVVHRYCTGTGTHSWGFWEEDLADFLEQTYGDAPASADCPNGWGPPTP
jgi:S-formylglutathione hydrolase FrmB